jgi:surface polysaccharide O-acyltransferase-like enzyme
MLGKFLVKKEMFTLYDIIKIPGIIILGPPYYHLWFLYMLMGLYLLTPIFRCFIKNCKKEHIEYFLLLFLIIGTCFPLINTILKNISLFKGREIYFPVVELTGYIGYYIAGYYFANYELKKKTKIIIYAFAILAMLSTIICTSFISVYKKEPIETLYGYLLPNTMFVAYAVFLLFKELNNKIEFSIKQEKMIINFSKDTFGIYLVHALVLQIFPIIGIQTLMINPIISIPIIAILAMAISYLCTKIIRMIPILKEYII